MCPLREKHPKLCKVSIKEAHGGVLNDGRVTVQGAFDFGPGGEVTQ